MIIKILNKKFELVNVEDTYESFIWTERYNECGEFELVVPATEANISKYIKDYYIEIDDSDRTMIIETLELTSDGESGIKMSVKGRSLESILERRIIWNDLVLNEKEDAKLYETLETLFVNTLMVNSKGEYPSKNKNRVIDGFKYNKPTDDKLKSVKVDDKYELSTGDSLYETVVALCDEEHVGWKIIRSGTDLVFSLYLGTDRSYKQTSNSYVIFSPEFENVINCEYVESSTTFKNVARVTASGPNGDVAVAVGSGSGIDRKEVHFSLDVTVTEKDKSVSGHFETKLKARAKKELNKIEYCETKTFTGKIDAEHLFVYRKDFFIGDVVELVNELGVSSHVRITEFVISISDQGSDYYPTFIDIATEKSSDVAEEGN